MSRRFSILAIVSEYDRSADTRLPRDCSPHLKSQTYMTLLFMRPSSPAFRTVQHMIRPHSFLHTSAEHPEALDFHWFI
jgi:hypothetical protein